MDRTVRALEQHGRVPVSDAVRQRILSEFAQQTGAFQETIAGAAVEAADAGREQTVGTLLNKGVDVTFRGFSGQIHKRIREHAFEASKQTMKRMTGDVMGNLAISYEEGLGIGEAASRLETEFDSMKRYELERVARTEINGFQNEGAHRTMEDYSVEYEQWWGAEDDRVRDSHTHMHGQIVKTGERFSNGLEYPGDRGGPIEEWINCRCRPVPFIMPEGYMAPLGKDYFYEADLVPIEEEVREQDLNRKVKAEEKELWDETAKDGLEHGSLFDKEGNAVVQDRTGTEQAVRWRADELLEARDGVLTHTHPPGAFPGLSKKDVQVAQRYGLGEMRAKSGNKVYTLKPPSKGYPTLTDDAFEEMYEGVRLQVHKKLDKQIRAGKLTREAYNQQILPAVNEEFAKKIGASFRVEDSF